LTSRPLLSIVFDRTIVKYVAHGHRIFRTIRHSNTMVSEAKPSTAGARAPAAVTLLQRSMLWEDCDAALRSKWLSLNSRCCLYAEEDVSRRCNTISIRVPIASWLFDSLEFHVSACSHSFFFFVSGVDGLPQQRLPRTKIGHVSDKF
jgi:hypothetical protein